MPIILIKLIDIVTLLITKGTLTHKGLGLDLDQIWTR